MPRYEITSPDGQVFEVDAPEGATEQDAIAYVQSNMQSSETVTPEATPIDDNRSNANKIGRQLGLTGRYLIEGPANVMGIFSDPIAGISNAALGTNLKPLSQATSNILDSAGFPKPETKMERNVGEASKLLAGTGGIITSAARQAANVASPVAQKVLTSIASRPGLQASGSIGAGLAGSEAREQGASPTAQFLSTVAGGLAAPLAVSGLQNLGKSVANAVKNQFSSGAAEKIAANKIAQAGINLSDLPKDIQKSITMDVQNAMKTGKDLSPDALRRLADYKQVGATPMGSSLTLKPADITRDRNLAKMSANSKDPAAQQLANLQRDNDIKLISGLNKLGAETADDAITAGNKLINYLDVKDTATKNVINKYYSQARATTGRSAKLDHVQFTNKANDLLDESLLGGKLPSDVKNILNSIAQGKTPLTVDVAEQYKTAIGTLQRSSNDAAERLALSKVREALDDTPLLEGQGQLAIDAFNKARGAFKAYMNIVDKTPALKAVRDGVEPDKFVNTFILGQGGKANVADVKALRESLKNNPEAVNTVKGQIASYLKSQATGSKADEVANFSPSNYSKALKNIGDDKLNLFFTPEDIKMLKAIGRVSSYEKFQPTGSAVNNSNTSAALLTAMLDKVANSAVIRKIPLGGALIADPAKDVAVAVGSRNALNASKALTLPKPKVKSTGNVPIGALLGLGSVSENDSN